MLITLGACGDDGGSTPDGATGDASTADGSFDASRPEASTPQDSGPRDNTCDSIQVQSDPIPTHVMVVLDASGSMYQPDDGVDRWNPAVSAVESVTASLESQLRFGLMLFPGGEDALCDAGDIVASTSLDNAAAIQSALTGDPGTLTGGGTPTATTLAAAGQALSMETGNKFVLLVTDGAPACNGDLNPDTCTCVAPPSAPAAACEQSLNCLDAAETIAAVEDLAAQGIQTYVIGFDTERWTSVLDSMAAAGGTGRDTHIPVGDEATLETALRDLSQSTVPCTFELDMAPSDIRFVRVELDGEMVDHVSFTDGGSNGWQLSGDQTVELVGDTCSTIQDGREHNLSITVECEPVQLI
jgi:Mg-chelatase subunit ChlD